MKKYKEGPILLYGIPFLLTFALYFLLKAILPVKGFMYTFLFMSWPIQFLSTYLFFVGFVYWLLRFNRFKRERHAYDIVQIPEISISREDIPTIEKAIPQEFSETLTLRRIKELLLALKYGEDILRLNEELSRRDINDVDRGHLTLDILRNLIPVIGFLGTVIGLSLAMIAFPQITEPEALKAALKDFASSLSVAFNTTLLALAYTIIVIMLASFLRQREESLVAEVDTQIRLFISKIKISTDEKEETDTFATKQLLVLLTKGKYNRLAKRNKKRRI